MKFDITRDIGDAVTVAAAAGVAVNGDAAPATSCLALFEPARIEKFRVFVATNKRRVNALARNIFFLYIFVFSSKKEENFKILRV